MARYRRRYRNFCPTPSDDAVVHGIDDQIAYLTRLLDRGNMAMFLKRLTELSAKLLSPALAGRALFIPELDELARRASLSFRPDPDSSTNSKLLVHVASVVHPTGGHTRVIEDIVAALPEYEHALIITDMPNLAPMDLAPLMPRFLGLGLKVHLLRATSPTKKVRHLSSLVTALGPRVLFLHAHHADSIAFVGIAGEAAPRVAFVHMCDHMPALGPFRTDYTHIDLTPACHSICASHAGLHPFLLNLTVRDIGTVELPQDRPIIAATCGSPGKYAGSCEFSYAQLLAALLSAGVAQVFHIGAMPDEQKSQIQAEITAGGQNDQRVVFLPNTPSLAAKLIEISPHFYLVSHPTVGGKATVEALSVGLPILHARPASGLPLLTGDITFGTSVTVSTLDQIASAVHRLEAEGNMLAKTSRAVYEQHYSPAAFREGLLSVIGVDR